MSVEGTVIMVPASQSEGPSLPGTVQISEGVSASMIIVMIVVTTVMTSIMMTEGVNIIAWGAILQGEGGHCSQWSDDTTSSDKHSDVKKENTTAWLDKSKSHDKWKSRQQQMEMPTAESRSEDCNSSHSLSEAVSSDMTTNQTDNPIVITIASAGAVASCIPSDKVTVGHRRHLVSRESSPVALTCPERSNSSFSLVTNTQQWNHLTLAWQSMKDTTH